MCWEKQQPIGILIAAIYTAMPAALRLPIIHTIQRCDPGCRKSVK